MWNSRPGRTWHFKDETILVNEEIKAEPLVVRKALAMEYVARNLPACIKPDELIVGNPNQNSVGFGVVFPIYATQEELDKAAYYVLDQASVWGHHPPDYARFIRKGVDGIKAEIHEAMDKEFRKFEPRPQALAPVPGHDHRPGGRRQVHRKTRPGRFEGRPGRGRIPFGGGSFLKSTGYAAGCRACRRKATRKPFSPIGRCTPC